MIRHSVTIAFRNFWKNKLYTVVNIISLSIGITVALAMFRYNQFENSYDNYHEKKDQIYRVVRKYQGEEEGDAKTGGALVPAIIGKYPEIKEYVRVAYFGDFNVNYKNEQIPEKKLIFADPAILRVFTFPLLAGDPNTALKDPFSVLITKEIAEKYFGNDNPVGKFLPFRVPLKVTGILKDIPDNSHFRFNILAPFDAIKLFVPGFFPESDWNRNIYTYILLEKNNSKVDLEKKLNDYRVKNLPDAVFYMPYEFKTEKLTEIHLNSRCEGYLVDIQLKFNDKLLYIIIFLGILVLAIACVNSINLSTACSVLRNKEVGIKKIFGAQRFKLILQFLVESFVITLLSLMVAGTLSELVLRIVGNSINRNLEINYFQNPEYLVGALIIASVVAILSGLYPAIIISSFSPLKVFRSSYKGKNGAFLKKILIVIQFSVSISLAILTVFLFGVLDSLINGKLGFNQENLFVLKMNKQINEKYPLFKSELKKLPSIKNISASLNEPSYDGFSTVYLKEDTLKDQSLIHIAVDYDFFQTIETPLKKGRLLNQSFADDDKSNFLVNECAVLKLNLNIGKRLALYERKNNTDTLTYQGSIVGIVNNYAYRLAIDRMQPVVFSYNPAKFKNILIRTEKENQVMAIKQIKQVWEKIYPQIPFKCVPIKQDIEEQEIVRMIKKFFQFFIYASILALIIAIVGLIGLALFSTFQRVKEISLRKVFGSTVSSIIYLLIKEFTILVIISNIIAFIPVKMMIDGVNSNMPNPYFISYTVFITVGIASLIISTGTIIILILRTARTNPANILRYE